MSNLELLIAPPVIGAVLGLTSVYVYGNGICHLLNRRPWVLYTAGGLLGLGAGVYFTGVMRTGSLLTLPV
jgi:hypothetical protein